MPNQRVQPQVCCRIVVVSSPFSPADVLGPDGPLTRRLSGFAPRAPQQAMAAAVANALDENGCLVVEAGTGTGKTFAYLVPALLSGGKVIVSTGTKNLQDQLFHRDLPVVREALGVPLRAALLKGRANYLCAHRLGLAELEGRARSRTQEAELLRIRDWAGRTRSGDIAEVVDVPEDSSVWSAVTSTVENCLGQDCAHLADCHVMKARRAAQEADVVVVNHHLLFADMALKEGGFGELLPGANAFVLDEAHQLPDVASDFFGLSLGGRQLLDLARDAMAEQQREAGDMEDIPKAAERLEQAALDLRQALGPELRRAAWHEVSGKPGVAAACQAVQEGLLALEKALEPAAQRGKGLEVCLRRSQDLLERFARVSQSPAEGEVQWFETYTRSFTLNLTPMEIAEAFRSHMGRYKSAWVFTSATLAVGDSFGHFTDRLGLQEAETLQLESPFDYARNALLYIPTAMPDPNDRAYTAAVVEAALPVIEASRGRAFLLFTSHRALKEAAELLQGRLEYELLIQGSAPRRELLERFRTNGNAVLLGAASFWEGVDVRGSALSCVIIDRLPFASPGDPVLQARIEALRARGGNPFMEHQLPNAVIALKQGVGRLIRDVNDCGVMMLCDPRVFSKPYGRVFLDSLPPMRRTRRLEDAWAFLAAEGEP